MITDYTLRTLVEGTVAHVEGIVSINKAIEHLKEAQQKLQGNDPQNRAYANDVREALKPLEVLAKAMTANIRCRDKQMDGRINFLTKNMDGRCEYHYERGGKCMEQAVRDSHGMMCCESHAKERDVYFK